MEQAVYSIRTITNLHMGDIGSSVSIIDKTVQKDAITGYPIIYATSFKGALRDDMGTKLSEDDINTIFGNTTATGASKGKYRFNDAHLLFYPVRSNQRPYYLAVSPMLLEQACQIMGLANRDTTIIKNFQNLEKDVLYANDRNEKDVIVDNFSVNRKLAETETAKKLLKLFNVSNEPGLLYLSDEKMSELLEQLPIIARNKLDNGISANLWYEEYVPRKSVFITMLSRETTVENLDKKLKNGHLFQMGANATVGYGLTEIKEVFQGGNPA